MKQVILVRQDLQLPKGKLAVQVAHAAVEAAQKCSASKVMDWQWGGAKKVVLKVANEAELRQYQRKAAAAKIVSALIRDAGKTVLAPGTVTALGIGPDDEEKIEALTGALRML